MRNNGVCKQEMQENTEDRRGYKCFGSYIFSVWLLPHQFVWQS